MASEIESFCPGYGSGLTVTPNVASASSTLAFDSTGVVLTNLSTTITAYVRIGTGAQTATTADYPLLPGTQVSLSKARGERTVAYIAPGGAGSLHIISGRGV